MNWVLASSVAIVVVMAIRLLLYIVGEYNMFGQNEGWEAFATNIANLVVFFENKSSLHVKHRQSEIAFDFVRTDGTDGRAVVILRIPRARWSEEGCQSILKVL